MNEPGSSFDADVYRRNAHFVPELGEAVLELLDPRPGESVLDLGAGDGVLTAAMIARGARVVALDASPSMVNAARARGLDARLGCGESLSYEAEFDAVFSNAALHWMTRPHEVARGAHRALRPGGRFVGELGGHGCCAAIRVALHAAIEHHGGSAEGVDPWYFPSALGYRRVLEGAGFEVTHLAEFARPTALGAGFVGWMETFAAAHLARVPEELRRSVLEDAARRLAPVLVDDSGMAVADYVRVRFSARRP